MLSAVLAPAREGRVPRAPSSLAAGEPPGRAVRRGTLVLGLSTGAGAAAALFDGQQIVAAVEEEKLTRSRAPVLVPMRAIGFCLQQAGATAEDLTGIALSNRTTRAWARAQVVRARWGMLPVRSGLGTSGAFERQMRRMLPGGSRLDRLLRYYDHHLCHAAAAFYGGPAERALVLTMDAGGDMVTGRAALGENGSLRPISSSVFPHALAWLYSEVTGLLGFTRDVEEQRVQWLASRGTPELAEVFRRIVDVPDGGGLPRLRRRCLRVEGGRWRLSRDCIERLGLRDDGTPVDPVHAAMVAASLQEVTECAVVTVADALGRRHTVDDLCVAGGLFLNTFLVRALEERSGFRRVFVHPAPGNAGAAIGAALLGTGAGARRAPASHAYLGPEFDAVQVKAVLDNCKATYRYYESDEALYADVVRLLGRGHSVAWYQGRAEFGFRALGNRSILASPFSPYVAQNLNQYLKHRDASHPFLLSVPEEAAANWFDCSENCRFAASMGRLRAPMASLEPFAAGGRGVRVHAVDRDVNPRFWRLLHRFGQSAPAPILVNTSFNLFGEPLVCDPREAIRSFACAGIDALVMGSFVLTK